MIAKITRGSSADGLARYLHGAGKGTEHLIQLPDGREHRGGLVVMSNIAGVNRGDLDGRGWAKAMERAMWVRPEIKNPVWHCSLNLAPGDRRLTDAEWADAATEFLRLMEVDSQPVAAVRHDDRGIHLAVSRVDAAGEVWSRSNDFRRAQKARQAIELEFGLVSAPTHKDRTDQVGQVADRIATEVAASPTGQVEFEAEGERYRVRASGSPERPAVWVPAFVQEHGHQPIGVTVTRWNPLAEAWAFLKNGLRTLAAAVLRQEQQQEAASQVQLLAAIDPLAVDLLAVDPFTGEPGPGPSGFGAQGPVL